jgi:homoserine dehydrogenase
MLMADPAVVLPNKDLTAASFKEIWAVAERPSSVFT